MGRGTQGQGCKGADWHRGRGKGQTESLSQHHKHTPGQTSFTTLGSHPPCSGPVQAEVLSRPRTLQKHLAPARQCGWSQPQCAPAIKRRLEALLADYVLEPYK